MNVLCLHVSGCKYTEAGAEVLWWTFSQLRCSNRLFSIHSVIVNVVKQLKGQHLYWFENTQRCQNAKLPICVGVGSITLQKLARKPIWWKLMRYFGVKNRGLYRTQCTFRSLHYVRYLLVYPLAYRRPPPMDMGEWRLASYYNFMLKKTPCSSFLSLKSEFITYKKSFPIHLPNPLRL